MATKIKYFIKEYQDIIPILIAIPILSMLFIILSNNNLTSSQNYPNINEHMTELETLMSNYSDYYTVIDKERNHIIHTIDSIDLDNNHSVFLVPDNFNEKDTVIDFYTGWDELITSYKCDFSDNKTYTINNKTLSLEKSSLQFLYIDGDAQKLFHLDDYRHHENPDEKQEEKPKVNISVTTNKGTQIVTLNGTLKPRGASTWELYNRKPYSLKLSEKVNLFGLGIDKKWNLLANTTDKTLLKNHEFYNLANSLDLEYTPKIKEINLYINNDYKGVYSVSTKANVGKNTVNINPNDFLFNWAGPNYETKIEYDCNFYTGLDNIFQFVDIVNPDAEKLTTTQKQEAETIIQNFVDTIEHKNNKNLEDVIDIESFAKYYWVQEISMNADAWYRSHYMYYKHSDGKLYAGPVWDMEWTIGAVIDNHNGIYFDDPKEWKIRNSGYYPYLFQNEKFVSEVNKIYNDYHLDKLMDKTKENFITDSHKLATEGNINFILCREEINYHDIDESAASYEDWVNMKTSFFDSRIKWIQNEMKNFNKT